jgi:hypothetical protein
MAHRPLLLPLLGLVVATASLTAQGVPDYEQAPVSYSTTAPADALARLRERMASGALAFPGGEREALRTLLEALEVPVGTQTLVFSKTSLQRARIRPERPRALYYSDSVYVGWVPGGLMEVTAVDPRLGPIFYSVELAPARDRPPVITRDSDCLRCHGGTFVRDVPGVFIRSIFPDRSGEPMLRHGSLVVDDETPFEQRWGGWYVTGYQGAMAHRGNAFGAEQGDALVFLPSGRRPDELSGFLDTDTYLRPTSDVAALLILEHQTAMQNALTRAGLACRRMIAYQHGLQKTFREPETDEPAYDSVKSVFAGSVQDVLDHLLFRRASTLPDGIRSTAEFRRDFPRGAPRSQAGHSLKDLDLGGRIFAQRCSYLIYSPSFTALPEPLKARILDRLQAVLLGTEAGDRYAYLPGEERRRIHEILRETHPEAARRWALAGR